MPEIHVHSNEGQIKLAIDPSTIKATKSYFNPILAIPIRLTFRMMMGSQYSSLQLIGCESRLKYRGHDVAVQTSIPNRLLLSQEETNFPIEFILDERRLAKIEELRQKDADFSISFMLHLALFSDLKINNVSQRMITSFSWAFGEMEFGLPQSDWVDILNDLGYKAFSIIEIPAANTIIQPHFDKSLEELSHASRYLLAGEYDKVVAHCRTALDPIRGLFPGIAKVVKNGLSTEWADTINSATIEWLDKIFKFQADLGNKTHHPPSMGHFSKQEAEAIYLLAVATISIGGKLEPLPKTES
jgi:hypothetical protein